MSMNEDTIREAFYQFYKSQRDLIAEHSHIKIVNPLIRNLLEDMKVNCNRYDRANSDMLERWKKENATCK